MTKVFFTRTITVHPSVIDFVVTMLDENVQHPFAKTIIARRRRSARENPDKREAGDQNYVLLTVFDIVHPRSSSPFLTPGHQTEYDVLGTFGRHDFRCSWSDLGSGRVLSKSTVYRVEWSRGRSREEGAKGGSHLLHSEAPPHHRSQVPPLSMTSLFIAHSLPPPTEQQEPRRAIRER